MTMKHSSLEVLNKYVAENSEVFEADGELLFCKVCNTSVSFEKKYFVDQHLRTQKHIAKLASGYNKMTMKQSVLELLNKYVAEYSEVFETDGEILLCKVCKTPVNFAKKYFVDQHLKTQKHIVKLAEINEPEEPVSKELLDKYVSESRNVFETDGRILFCNACNAIVASDKKYLVDKHLRSQNHNKNLKGVVEDEPNSTLSNEECLDEKYESENSDVFEDDGKQFIRKMSVSYEEEFSVDQHLGSQEHNDKYEIINEVEGIALNKDLLHKYVSENIDILETDGKELFCKICKKSISFGTKHLVYRHLSSKSHQLVASKLEAKIKRRKRWTAELLNKYVTENVKVFETDGVMLFCKACKKSVSFEKKYSVDQHLKTQKHKDNSLQYIVNDPNLIACKNRQLSVELLNRYVSENSDVFETDGEILICKVCKTSVSFEKKYSVDQHLKTQKHKDNSDQYFQNPPEDVPTKNVIISKRNSCKQSSVELLNKYVSENANVFETDGDILFCKVCNKSVSFNKKYAVDQHLKTQKHRDNLSQGVRKTIHNVTTATDLSDKRHPFILEITEDLCRTCMKQLSKTNQNDDGKQSITEIPNGYQNNLSIMELLEIIQPQIKLEIKESLPTLICSDCIKKLLASFEFIEMYQNVDKKLRKMLEEYNANNCNYNSLHEPPRQEFLEEMKVQNDVENTKCEIEQINIDELENEEWEMDARDNYWSKLENYMSDDDENNENELSEDAVNIENESCEDNVNNRNKLPEVAVNNESQMIEDASNVENDLSGDSDDDWIPEESWLNTSPHKEQNSDDIAKSLKRKIANKKLPKAGDYADNESLQCQQCETIFDSIKHLREHMRLTHVENKTKRAYNRRTNEPRRKVAPKVPRKIAKKQDGAYHCEHCNKKYSNYVYYITHMQSHKAEPHLCIECGKSFIRLTSLNQHMLRHKGEKNFKCPHCPSSFVCSSGLYGHMMVHNNNKPYVCDICGSAFHMAYQLRHHNLYHAGIKKFQCEYCEMKFVTREKQRRHMRTHTGEKPFRCKYCEKSFAQSNDCVKHLRQHLGDNVYQCDLCPLRFPLLRDLRAHFATHKDDDEETRARNLQAREKEELNLGLSSRGLFA